MGKAAGKVAAILLLAPMFSLGIIVAATWLVAMTYRIALDIVVSVYQFIDKEFER